MEETIPLRPFHCDKSPFDHVAAGQRGAARQAKGFVYRNRDPRIISPTSR